MTRKLRTSVSVVPELKGPSAPSRHSNSLSDKPSTGRGKGRKKQWPIYTILRRLVVIAAAARYIQVSLWATWYAWEVLNATPNPTETLKVFSSPLITKYLGDGPVHDSPLVRDVLASDTTPRDHAIFLESETKISFNNCSDVPLFNQDIYNYTFLSRSYWEMVNDSQYTVTTLSKLELVVIVIDCSFTPLVTGDPSAVRTYNLVRSQDDSKELYLVMASLNVQNYEIHNYKRRGPGLLAMLTVIHDMSEGVDDQFYMLAETYPYQRSMDFEVYEPVGITEENFLELRSIAPDPDTQPMKQLTVARERGFYNGEAQSNARYMHTVQDTTDANRTLTKWEWVGETVSFDSYAWVHGIHLVFAIQTMFYLFVLCLVTYQKVRSGKFWIGDPFAPVSTASLVLRGVLVVLSMILNSFWMINEYCMSFAAAATGTQSVRIHQELLHADIMVLYLSLVGLLSSIFRERIDPAVAIFMFELIHSHRLALVRASSVILNEIVTYSDAQYFRGVVEVTPAIAAMSPLRFWTAYQLPNPDATFLISSFFPKAILLSIVAGFAIMRKMYRWCYPDPTTQRSNQTTDSSVDDKSAPVIRDIITHFEMSTGAELQTRFGLISDYSNYVYFKGMKFASADGVYCSGYVIANGKFLVSTTDLPVIFLMKLICLRFRNVYVYEVEGYSVKETARLVYPKTFMWSDLFHLNVTVLL